jgi:hypothetical protein
MILWKGGHQGWGLCLVADARGGEGGTCLGRKEQDGRWELYMSLPPPSGLLFQQQGDEDYCVLVTCTLPPLCPFVCVCVCVCLCVICAAPFSPPPRRLGQQRPRLREKPHPHRFLRAAILARRSRVSSRRAAKEKRRKERKERRKSAGCCRVGPKALHVLDHRTDTPERGTRVPSLACSRSTLAGVIRQPGIVHAWVLVCAVVLESEAKSTTGN